MGDRAARHELVGDRLGRIDGDREADPLRLHPLLGLPRRERVDADYVAVQVHERPARVTRVDGRVGLHEVKQVWTRLRLGRLERIEAVTTLAALTLLARWFLHGA